MSLYWFWFLFPILLSMAVTTFEVYRADCEDVSPKYAMAFFLFTGLLALFPAWYAFYADLASYFGEILIPTDQLDTPIAEFTVFFAMCVVLVLHIILVFPLIPVLLAKLIARIGNSRKTTQ